MMGLNHDQGQLFYSLCLEEAVPDDHLVREIAAVLDLALWLAFNRTKREYSLLWQLIERSFSLVGGLIPENASERAAAEVTSITRLRTNGPQSLIRTTPGWPLRRLVRRALGSPKEADSFAARCECEDGTSRPYISHQSARVEAYAGWRPASGALGARFTIRRNNGAGA
jgi:hypothetical protein